tara:strand:+ start:150 stop:278 length:129 start_codon:yes stop_codon:yes gene_type:complete
MLYTAENFNQIINLKMGYPKKHRGRRKQGSKKRRAKRKNKKK